MMHIFPKDGAFTSLEPGNHLVYDKVSNWPVTCFKTFKIWKRAAAMQGMPCLTISILYLTFPGLQENNDDPVTLKLCGAACSFAIFGNACYAFPELGVNIEEVIPSKKLVQWALNEYR